MDWNSINLSLEDYLNKKTNNLQIDFSLASNAREQFLLRCIKRVKITFDLLQFGQCGQNDFLIALRNYLLSSNQTLALSRSLVPDQNEFGIGLDTLSGRYFASFQFPSYVNAEFAESAFLTKDQPEKSREDRHELHTDPAIQKITGFSHFKTMAQKLAVYGALNTPEGYTTLISLPTGGGKSLITQTLAYQNSGLTITIVPTVSLAIDQERVARELIKSSQPKEEIFYYSGGVDIKPILNAIRNHTARLLFISPEALIGNPLFVDVINEANKTRYLKNIIIDEAHIVIDWGASFRVDYQCLESWRKALMRSNPGIRTILLSATFEKRCVSLLKDFFSDHGEKWIEIRCDALRHEPRYMLVKSNSEHEKKKKALELVRKLPHPMIIYVVRPDEAETTAQFLSQNGIQNVRTFTGRTTSADRNKLIETWADDQYEIMVATSAFGIGVDKSDVRTVLHLYVPQNPNAYYQELGRGGRDRLPCLSVMCISRNDLDVAFGRISKSVMTTEKIVGRWVTMFTHPSSKRYGNLIYIDTSVKPRYAEIDEFDDVPTSDADMHWNIYVLLFLRRYGLIQIEELISVNGRYQFVIQIQHDALRMDDEELWSTIDAYRAKEWAYYSGAFARMKRSVLDADQSCWSEMFFETYDKVSEYCAGCSEHTEPNDSDFLDFPLKTPVQVPVRTLHEDQIALFSGTRNVICVSSKDEMTPLIKKLGKYRISVWIFPEGTEDELPEGSEDNRHNTLILNPGDFRELMKKRSFFFLSGLIAVRYSGTPKDVSTMLSLVNSALSAVPEIRAIHILEENCFIESQGKRFADIVDGSIVTAKERLG